MIEIVGLTLLHFIWQGSLLLLVAWSVLFALRNRSAQSRYLAACGVLGLMALAPLFTALFVATGGPMSPGVPGGAVKDSDTLRLLVNGWMAGVAVFGLRCVGGFIAVARIRFTGRTPADADLQTRFAALAEKMGVRRLPRLYISTKVTAPAVIGAFRGVVLIPASVVTGLSPRMLETLLAHELAHVARYDFLINVIQSVIEIALFYHPAVWWLSGRIRQERENCCDDLVIAALGDRTSYVRALTKIEELRMTSLAMRADGGELLARVRRILGEKQMKTIASPTLIAIVLGALIAVPALQSYAAQKPASVPSVIIDRGDQIKNGSKNKVVDKGDRVKNGTKHKSKSKTKSHQVVIWKVKGKKASGKIYTWQYPAPVPPKVTGRGKLGIPGMPAAPAAMPPKGVPSAAAPRAPGAPAGMPPGVMPAAPGAPAPPAKGKPGVPPKQNGPGLGGPGAGAPPAGGPGGAGAGIPPSIPGLGGSPTPPSGPGLGGAPAKVPPPTNGH